MIADLLLVAPRHSGHPATDHQGARFSRGSAVHLEWNQLRPAFPLMKSFPLLLVLLLLFPLSGRAATPVRLFDGVTLTGWVGDTNKTWSIDNGEIVAGDVTKQQPRNEFLSTTRRFENFELRVKFKLTGTEGFVNGGVQFRTERIPNSFEVSGYQADFGAGYDGALYDESRRKKVLAQPSKDVLAKASKPGEWNDYRIRAEGAHIQLWLNGIQTVDYTEMDNAIARTGIVALQIHGGAKSQVRYKDIVIEEFPPTPKPVPPSAPAAGKSAAIGLTEPVALAKGPPARMTEKLPAARSLAPFGGGNFSPIANDIMVFIGPENTVIEQRVGWLETALALGLRDRQPRFRHMGWEGDTVYRQNRMMNWGSWQENLDAVGATTIIVWFGQMEALDITKTPDDFAIAYAALLDQLARRTPRIVIISPPPFEQPADSRVPDNRPRNVVVKQHADAARQLATQRGYVFIDLFTPLARRASIATSLTRDGIHFTAEGMFEISGTIARGLGVPGPSLGEKSLRAAIVEKNRLWFNTWRPMNWAFAYGDRTTQPFAQPANGNPSFVEELARHQPLIAHGDATVQAIAAGRSPPAPLPAEPPRADPAAVSPEEEKARFQVRDGFSVNLFADENLGVVRPLQIRWDERGRLWVVCAPSYPQLQPGERANDFILMLEDTNGDGRADKATRAAEGLTMPMGLEFGDGGIYVCENTQLIHLQDRDGDGKFEERRVVLSGFGTGDTHQSINSIRWGADGHLWFTQGYHIWSYVETPHGIVELNRSGLWRFNPRTLKLDSFLNESAAGLNAWGVTFDDFGQVFHASGADVAVWHTTPALVPTLNPLSLGAGLAISRGKSMEPEFLGSSHLPDDLHRVLLKSVYFTSQVRLYRLRDDGAGFSSEDLGDLLASTGNEFRPTETRVGPDGAIYVCDWLNTVIGHYQASYRDPRRDRSHGRIWRMTANGRKLSVRPSLEQMSVTQLMEQFSSPERWVRDQAKFALYRMPKAAVLVAADTLLRAPLAGGRQDQERMLYELSGVFAAHEEVRPVIIEQLIKSDDFRWRAWGTHLVGVWAGKLADPLSILARAVVDEHPRVRMEAVVACSWVTNAAAVKIATLVMEKPLDASINYALTQCIHAQAPRWRPALASGQLDFGSRFHALARVLTTVGDTSVVDRVRELLTSGKFGGRERDSLLGVLVENGSPKDVEFAIAHAPDSQSVLEAVVTMAFRKRDASYGPVLQGLLTSPYPAARIAGCRAAAAWGRDFGQLARIQEIAANSGTTSMERGAAIMAIARIKGTMSLNELFPYTESSDAIVQNAALEAVAPFDPARVAARCLTLLASATTEAEAGAVLRPLLNLANGAVVLSKAASNIKISETSARLALKWMGMAGRDDRALVDVLRSAAGIVAARPDYSADLVNQWVADAKARGNVQRGAAILRRPDLACLGCHRVGNEGGVTEGLPLAPELGAIGRAMTPEMIVESVLWPKRQVKEGFLLTKLTTKDGREFQGYKSAENATELKLRMFDSTELVVRRSDIAARTDAGTLMPEGLADPLSAEQRNDLLRHLFELGR